MTRRIVQLAGSRAEFALADDGTIWLWTGSGWANASRGPLPETVKEFIARVGDTVAPEQEKPMTLREEIDQKKAEMVKELDIKPLTPEFITAGGKNVTEEVVKVLAEFASSAPRPKRGRPKKVAS